MLKISCMNDLNVAVLVNIVYYEIFN